MSRERSTNGAANYGPTWTTIFNGMGIPEPIAKLLEFARKADAEAFVKTLQLTSNHFMGLLYNHARASWTHRRKHGQFIPEHLKITNEENESFFQGSDVGPMSDAGRKHFKKVTNTFRERQVRHVHMFEGGDQWHCFYFTHSDAFFENNHWVGGKHLHYVSHLWTVDRDVVWTAFDKRNAKIPSTHISFDYENETKPFKPA